MLDLQIKNEEQFLLDELKKELQEKISKLQCGVESAASFLEYGIERKPYMSENDFEFWMKGYTVKQKTYQYQLEWFEKKYNELCLTL